MKGSVAVPVRWQSLHFSIALFTLAAVDLCHAAWRRLLEKTRGEYERLPWTSSRIAVAWLGRLAEMPLLALKEDVAWPRYRGRSVHGMSLCTCEIGALVLHPSAPDGTGLASYTAALRTISLLPMFVLQGLPALIWGFCVAWVSVWRLRFRRDLGNCACFKDAYVVVGPTLVLV